MSIDCDDNLSLTELSGSLSDDLIQRDPGELHVLSAVWQLPPVGANIDDQSVTSAFPGISTTTDGTFDQGSQLNRLNVSASTKFPVQAVDWSVER